MEHGNILDRVESNQLNGHYGNTKGMTVNDMYKKYAVWFCEKYPTPAKPLSFKHWLKWAQKKGLAKENVAKKEVFNVVEDKEAAAENVPPAVIPTTVIEPVAPLKASGTSKFVAFSILAVSLFFIFYNLRQNKITAV